MILYFLGEERKWDATWLFLVIWHQCHSHQHYMMLMASSMAPLHSLGQYIQNEVQHDLFSHVTPLLPLSMSHNATGIINGTTAFLPWVKAIKLRWTRYICYVMPLAPALHDAHGIFSCTTAFLKPRWSKWGTTWVLFVMPQHWCQHWHHMMPMVSLMAPLHFLGQDNWIEIQCDFWFCDAIGTGITWHQWHWALMQALVLAQAPNVILYL